MKAFHEGQLVTLVGERSELDAIVVHEPSLVKIEVAVADAERGAVFRTVHPKTLRQRSAVGEHDNALRRRIRRAPSARRPRPPRGGGRRGRGRPPLSGPPPPGK